MHNIFSKNSTELIKIPKKNNKVNIVSIFLFKISIISKNTKIILFFPFNQLKKNIFSKRKLKKNLQKNLIFFLSTTIWAVKTSFFLHDSITSFTNIFERQNCIIWLLFFR